MILKVTPKKQGTIVIEKVQWELLGLFRCEMPFVGAACKDILLPKKLLEKEKIF